MTNDLDTRARAGARALHDAVRDLPVPAAAPTRSPHRVACSCWSPPPPIVVVAVTAALLGERRGRAARSAPTPPAAPPASCSTRRPRPGGHRCGDLRGQGESPACGARSGSTATPAPPIRSRTVTSAWCT